MRRNTTSLIETSYLTDIYSKRCRSSTPMQVNRSFCY
jgi:hypothetical protein